jgi:hypothetical protein
MNSESEGQMAQRVTIEEEEEEEEEEYYHRHNFVCHGRDYNELSTM